MAIMITTKLAAPVLIVSLAVGLGVSLVQSVTQIQEFTLTFVPKLAGIGLVILFAGHWMLNEWIGFTQQLFSLIPSLINT
jgi:flagellar biosynthetic protein FliQ